MSADIKQTEQAELARISVHGAEMVREGLIESTRLYIIISLFLKCKVDVGG
jgi:hypothetical protein